MKLISVSAILIMAVSAFAGPLESSATPKWISIETGITPTEQLNTTSTGVQLEKRTGTEVVTCYGFGTAADRAPITSVIDDWCRNTAIGKWVPNGSTIWARYNYGTFTVLVSGAAINCGGFTVDGNCNRLLRLPVDGCNTGGVNGKQGGYVTDLCGQWRTDPGSNGSDV